MVKKQNAKTQDTSYIPEGYESTRGELHEIREMKIGEPISGKFLGIKVLPSKFNKDGSVLWTLCDEEGEVFLVNEKTTMSDLRISQKVKEGTEVMIVYHGDKKGKRGQYKDIEVLIKKSAF